MDPRKFRALRESGKWIINEDQLPFTLRAQAKNSYDRWAKKHGMINNAF